MIKAGKCDVASNCNTNLFVRSGRRPSDLQAMQIHGDAVLLKRNRLERIAHFGGSVCIVINKVGASRICPHAVAEVIEMS